MKKRTIYTTLSYLDLILLVSSLLSIVGYYSYFVLFLFIVYRSNEQLLLNVGWNIEENKPNTVQIIGAKNT